MKNLVFLFGCFTIFTFGSCEEDPSPPAPLCNESAVLDDEAFDQSRSDDFELDSAWISGNCLNVKYWYGGGCGDTEMKLIGKRDKTFQLPPSLSVKLVFKDRDYCKAYIQTSKSFDITPFQQTDSKVLTFRINGVTESFEYTY